MKRQSLAVILALAASASAAAAESEWATYRSPSGFYSVDHPNDWRVERNKNIVNIIPGDDSGAVTISAYLGKAAAGYPERLIAETFEAFQPTSPLLTVTGRGWKGVRRTFLDTVATPHRELVVVVATSAAGMVIITWNEKSPMIEKLAPIHERIFGSLKLSKPKR